MRRSTSWKMIFRAPFKTLLTFLLVAAASFALFSQVADYAIVRRGREAAEGYYHCVARLDNEIPDHYYTLAEAVSRDQSEWLAYTGFEEAPDKPWPSEEERREFESLPGVTLSDTRYMTAGLVEDYGRQTDAGQIGLGYVPVLFEGTYAGYEDDTKDEIPEGHVRLKFDDVEVIACETDLDVGGSSIELAPSPLGDNYYAKSPYDREFFDGIREGSRCLVLGYYTGNTADAPIGFWYEDPEGKIPQSEGYLRVVDGLPDDYLETEEFSREKGWADAIRQWGSAYDMVYTSDMRAMGYEAKDVKGRMLTEGDTDVCVVSEAFLEEHGLSIGDAISVKLGDRAVPFGDGMGSVRAYEGADLPEFSDPVEVTVVGAYEEGSLPPSVVFLPSALMQAKIPEGYETPWQDYSVYVEDAEEIEAFLEGAEAFAESHGLRLDASDGGWMDVKDSFGRGERMSLLTTSLYLAGAALALFLAAYLYVGRNRKTYAVMRAFGVPGKEAALSAVLPFAALASLAVLLGGASGLFYARRAAAASLAGLMENAPEGYAPDMGLPAGAAVLCVALELVVLLAAAGSFLWRMGKTPPLEMLQEGPPRHGQGRRLQGSAFGETPSDPVRPDFAKLQGSDVSARHGKYGAARHVLSYSMRHMGRGVGRAAASLALSAVLAGGVGIFVLAECAYQDAFYEYGVAAEAYQYAFSSVERLSKTPLAKDFYCHSTSDVHIKGMDGVSYLTISNDIPRCLGEGCAVEYADGFGEKSFEGTGQICLVGAELAKELGIGPGDEVGMLSGDLYYMLWNEEKDGDAGVLENGYKQYQVAGIVEAGDGEASRSVFTGIRGDLTRLYGGVDFMFDYCGFTLSDNDRLGELEALLEDEAGSSLTYAPYAAYRVDSDGLGDIVRIQELLGGLFPVAVASAVLVGAAGTLLMILQSAQEAAILRILGTTKARARCMLALGQAFLCAAGAALAALALCLCSPGLFAEGGGTLAACFGLYLFGCACGACAAAAYVTRHRLLELLQVKE